MRSFFVGSVLALAAATFGANAETQFGLMQKMCFDTLADGDKALAIADGMGWLQAPQSLMDKFPKGELDSVRSRIWSDSAGLSVLVVAQGHMPVSPEFIFSICMVGSAPGNPAETDKQAADYAGVPKHSTEKWDGYVWNEDNNGTHVAVDPKIADDDAKKLAGEGRLRFLITKNSEKMAMLLYAVPTRTGASPATH